MMHKALSIIRDEHRSIAAVLHDMQHLVSEIRQRNEKIDPRVFAAMLYYLDTFCERVHHHKKDPEGRLNAPKRCFCRTKPHSKRPGSSLSGLSPPHPAA